MARKSRAFTGCWTCRQRKVKCDVTKPTCNRCAQAKLKCLGYNIVLGWLAPLTVREGQLQTLDDYGDNLDNFQRRNVATVEFPPGMAYPTFKLLVAAIDGLEGHKRRRVGPFAVYEMPKRHRAKTAQPPSASPMAGSPPGATPSLFEATSQMTTPKTGASQGDTPLTVSSPQATSLERESSAPDITQLLADSVFSKTENTWVHYDYIDFAKLTIVAIKGLDYRFNEQNMLHILYPKFFPNVDLDEWEVDFAGALDMLIKPVGQGMLVKPFLVDIVQKFVLRLCSWGRIDFACNTHYERLVVPTILLIMCDFMLTGRLWPLLLRTDADEAPTAQQLLINIKLAVVALAISILTFKLLAPGKHSKYQYSVDLLLQLLIQMRKLGILILNYHLDEYDTNQSVDIDYEEMLLLAINLQIRADALFSVYENYEVVFAIGDNIIKELFRNRRLSNVARFLINWFKIVYFMYELTQHVNTFNYLVDDLGRNYRDLDENYDLILLDDDTPKPNEQRRNMVKQDEYLPMSFTISFDRTNQSTYNQAEQAPEYPRRLDLVTMQFTPSRTRLMGPVDTNTVYLMYGVPKNLMDVFHDIVHLTNHKNIFRRKKVFPRNFPRICAETYDRLLNWRHEWNLDLLDPFHRQLALYAHSFHQAVIVYYLKLIKEAPLELYQNHIDLLLTYLDKLGDAAPRYIKPMFWMLLVCGADALGEERQARVAALMTGPMYTSQPNYWRAKQILREIWRRRQAHEDVGFMDLVREWGICLHLA